MSKVLGQDMKVGDLVRHKRRNWYALVVTIDQPRRHIKLLDEESEVFWERMSDYEVISESR